MYGVVFRKDILQILTSGKHWGARVIIPLNSIMDKTYVDFNSKQPILRVSLKIRKCPLPFAIWTFLRRAGEIWALSTTGKSYFVGSRMKLVSCGFGRHYYENSAISNLKFAIELRNSFFPEIAVIVYRDVKHKDGCCFSLVRGSKWQGKVMEVDQSAGCRRGKGPSLLELAGSALGNSWCTVTGIAFMTGLSGALETLCGQGFGAKLYRTLGIHLQASCIISFLCSMIISISWLYTEPLLIFLGQDPQISKTAAIYLKYSIPGLFAFGFVQNILRFLQAQSVVMPLVLLSGIPMCIHVGVAYALVHKTALGFKGASLAASVSLWISAIVLEYWAFELLVLIAGMMPNAELTTSVIAICVNTQDIAYMCTSGLSATVSTRVSNELGAGNPDKAKHAMAMTLKLSVLLALLIVLSLAIGHDVWAGFFSDDLSIIKAFASMTPFLAISIALDAFQVVVSGFKDPTFGLWIGLICGLSCQTCALLLIILRSKWTKMDLSEPRDDGKENSNLP
ncbi:unnamed protein product [Dovyalis caffra]|uniref:Protein DETOXIFICATION n=1 Tax=Dovyalis caffra TaxID=77055 RepID=A0AAV1R1J2_9ROSI|nr:unnamed protein product [Dovyalis caffra]